MVYFVLSKPVQMETNTLHQLILWLHYLVSTSFLVSAVWLVIRSVRGITRQLPYTTLDKWLAYFFIINLYLQLLFGFILFTNLSSPIGYEYQSADGSLVNPNKRLWPFEHIVLMLFALFIANLGLIFSGKSTDANQKHRKILLYYAVSMILIAISLASIYFF